MDKVVVTRQLPKIPLWTMIVAGLAFGYLGCFILPVFFNSAQEMAFPRYIATINPIGIDLRLAYDFSKAWATGATPDLSSLVYPPLERVLRLPLLLFPFRGAFAVQTLTTILAFVSVVLLLPRRVSKSPDWTALSVLLFAGLFSYGMQFEFERGQSNVIAIAFVAWALFLFHYGTGLSTRLAAYLLFSCAIQLKLYPAIFVLGFTRDARDWRRNLVRWGALGAANVAGLFALGWDAFFAFWSTLTTNSSGFVGFGNHSIASFARIAQKLADGYTPQYYHPGEIAAAGARYRAIIPEAWQHAFGPVVGIVCMVTLLGCFAAVLAMAFHRNDRASFKYVMALCSLLALLVPNISFDYKLPLLIMAFTFYVSESHPIALNERMGVTRACLFFAVSLSLALTVFPSEYRPMVIWSATPLLFVMVVAFTLLMVLEKQRNPERENLPANLRE